MRGEIRWTSDADHVVTAYERAMITGVCQVMADGSGSWYRTIEGSHVTITLTRMRSSVPTIEIASQAGFRLGRYTGLGEAVSPRAPAHTADVEALVAAARQLASVDRDDLPPRIARLVSVLADRVSQYDDR